MSSPSPPEFHHHYGDPAANIVLRPTSGPAYRVHAWYLFQHSKYFERAYKNAEERGQLAEGSLHVEADVDSAALDLFLAFVYAHPRPHTAPKLESIGEHAFSLIGFAQLCECFEFLAAVADQIEPFEGHRLLDQLEKAVADDNEVLARWVIYALTPEKVTELGFWKIVDVLKDEWKIPFMRATLDSALAAIVFESDSDVRAAKFQDYLPVKRKWSGDELVQEPERKKRTARAGTVILLGDLPDEVEARTQEFGSKNEEVDAGSQTGSNVDEAIAPDTPEASDTETEPMEYDNDEEGSQNGW